MITSPLLKRPAIIAAICFIVLSIITLGFIIQPPQNKPGNKGYQVHKTFSAKEIKELLIKSKSDQLWLDVYPVKQSADVNKKDFDLVIVPRNKEGKPVTQNKKGAFVKGSANYAAFLHKKNIAPGAVPLGYQVTINELKLKDKGKVDIFINVLEPAFSKIYMSTPGQMNFSDSAPIGRCPPDCFFDPAITAIMAKEYGTGATKK